MISYSYIPSHASPSKHLANFLFLDAHLSLCLAPSALLPPPPPCPVGAALCNRLPVPKGKREEGRAGGARGGRPVGV